ncbi:hypothetical protein H2O64_10525 [Kordia sp. YSTF-M3]|uniref:Transmembrane protein n=1 Tax=Kordia aestuariivivens TaxID=2759037 RepID=A0ABR7Q9L0_9FLAO|nr:hypothetical protein [Kordia aestuariivivens]MBC8755108.1 hypothetical protein [Kordia aestuariivivens]
MKVVQKIKEITIASLFVVTLVLPSLIQFSHQLTEDHEYTWCKEQKAHIHEGNLHCDSCTYHFTNFIYEVTSLPKLELPPIIFKTTLGSTTPLCNYAPLTSKQLRAPPIFS